MHDLFIAVIYFYSMCIFFGALIQIVFANQIFFDIQQTLSYPEKYETYIFVHYCSFFYFR